MLKCFGFFSRAGRVGPTVIWAGTAFYTTDVVFLGSLSICGVYSLSILWIW